VFLRLLVILLLAFITACDVLSEKKIELTTIKTSAKNCLKHCKPMNKACEDFTTNQLACEKNKTESTCLDVVKSFKSMSDMHLLNSFDCKEACGHEFNDNRLRVCESQENSKYYKLTTRFMSMIKTHQSPLIKSLNLSEMFTRLKDEEFDKKYYKLKDKKLSFQMPKIFTIQEKTKESFEVWLRRKELDCLSDQTLKEIKKLEEKDKTKEYFDITNQYNNIAKSCGLKNTKAFPPKKGSDSNFKLAKVTYYKKAKPSAFDDCNYPTPRVVISYKGSTASDFILSKDFKAIEDANFKNYLAKLNENPKLYRKFGFNFFGAFSYKDKNFAFSGIPAMANAYELLEVTEYGLRNVPMSLFQEACGS